MKWISCAFLTLVLIFGFSASFVEGEESKSHEMMSLYSDFLDSKESIKYDILTQYQISQNYARRNNGETYFFSDHLLYRKTSVDNSGMIPGSLMGTSELLAILGEEGNETYFRTFRCNYSKNPANQQTIPFFRSDDSEIVTEIRLFFNNPIFHLGTIDDASSFTFSIDVSTLSAEYQTFLLSDLRRILPDAKLPEGGMIYYTFTSDGSKIIKIVADYHHLFEGVGLFSQTITLSYGAALDAGSLLAGAVNLAELSDWENTSLPTMDQGETVSFNQPFPSLMAQYVFIRIETPGEYVFSIDDSVQTPMWFLLDFDMKFYRYPYSFIDDGWYLGEDFPVYLEAGLYYLYMSPLPMPGRTASITFSLQNQQDDHPGSFSPDIVAPSGISSITFTTDYDGDVDAFLISGDYDVVIWSFAVGTGCGADGSIFFSIGDSSHMVSLVNPGYDFVLYFSSSSLGPHTISISFYSFCDTPVPLSEAPLIDLYAIDSGYRLALPFQGRQDSYAFDLREDSEVYASVQRGTLKIFDSSERLVVPTGNKTYTLPKGRYYVTIDEFTDETASFCIIPEPQGEDVRLLNLDSGSVQLQGFVNGLGDIDLFEVTFSNDTTIRFTGTRFWILMFGKDNPRVMVFHDYPQQDYLIPAGTYYLTLHQSDVSIPSVYNFLIEIVGIGSEGAE